MRSVHQFHFSIAPKDAVTGHMRFLQSALAEIGIGGEIFADEIRPGAGGKRFDAAAVEKGDLLLVHHSHGNPRLGELLGLSVPKALVYHNVTPGTFFRHDPFIASLCDLGRRQLIFFRGHIVASFAVSRYNGRELEAMGLPRPERLPLLDLAGAHPSPRFPPKSAANGGELLFVGKLAPHKNQALLVRMLYYLARMPGKDFRLTLAGGADPVYGDYVKLLAKSLKIEDRVRVTGKISDEALDLLYRGATAFVCASRHEGFCIPLVEAMRYGLPVMAFPVTGARETLGGAGLGLLTKKPHRMAEIVAAALEDPRVVAAILQGQSRRLESLAKTHSRARAQNLLTATLAKISRSADPIRLGAFHGATVSQQVTP